MTTIAYRDGVLASDSLVTANDWKMPFTLRKIERLPDGSLLGFAGNPYQHDAFRRWLLSPDKEQRPDLTDVSKAIVIERNGIVRLYQYVGCISPTGSFFAIGCGGPAAMAAMHMGADAKRAVEIAILLDNCTGGDIQIERLSDA